VDGTDGGIQATTPSERSLPWQARMLRIGRREQHKEGIAIVSGALLSSRVMKFSELIRLLEQEGFRLIKQKGSIRYYAKAGHPHLISCRFPWREGSADRHVPCDLEIGRFETKLETYDYAAIFTRD
jgi:hypothetical protein